MKLLNNLRWFFEKCRRVLAYAKLGYDNYDFDALTIENYLLFKLKRIEPCLINGHCDLTVEEGPKKMKALKLCIKILERLNNDDYTRFDKLHEKKWGKLEMWTEPTGDGFHRLKSRRERATTPELKEQERKEYIESFHADARLENRDRQLMYKIIAKYITYWWD